MINRIFLFRWYRKGAVSILDVDVSTFCRLVKMRNLGLLAIISSEAVILRSYPLKESDKIVVAYTRKYGKLRGVAKGSRRIRSRFSGRLEPLSWVDLVAFEKENRELVSIDKVELLKGFGLTFQDYQAYLRSCYLVELLEETIPDREVNETLFRLILHVLPQLGNSQKSEVATLYFQIWHLKLAGLLPDLAVCSGCGISFKSPLRIYYHPRQAGFLCESCQKGRIHWLSWESMKLLQCLIRRSLSDVVGVIRSSEEVRSLNILVGDMMEIGFERRFDCLSLLNQEIGNF